MKRMLEFIIPIWISMIINSLLTITDLFFLGQISKNYISVIGIGLIPFSLISSFTVGIGIETNRTLSKNDGFNFWYTSIFAVVFSIILITLSDLFSKYILFFVWNNPLYIDVKDYFLIINLSLIPSSILFICTGILRGKGVPNKSMFFSILAVMLNFIFDYIFIKLHVVGDPVKGCAYSSVLADSITIIVYVFYLLKKNYLETNLMNIYKFSKNAITNSLEKVFSVSSLQLISSLFVAKLSIDYSSVYFALDKFDMPLMLFSYSFLEWVIYSKSKMIKTKRIVYFYYFVLLLIYNFTIVMFLKTDEKDVIYTLSYICYLFVFLGERTIVGHFFYNEKGKIVNYAVFIKNLAMVITLFIIYASNKLSLISFGIINLLFLLFEFSFLYFLLRTKHMSTRSIFN